MRHLAAAAAVLIGGCTTLGPMPAATGVAPVPLARPGGQVSLAIAPGYYLSSGVTRDPHGAPFPQLSALLEPDRWIGIPGLIAGARLFGTEDAGTYLEPMLGYRRGFGPLSLGAVGYGTRGSHEHRDASLSVT